MTKLLIGLLGAGAIATGGYAAASGLDADPARTISLPSGATTSTTTTEDRALTAGTTTDGQEDVSGPCDEAEHRNDPRCSGSSLPAPATTTGEVEDDRADKPDDHSGRGSDDDHDDDEDHDDNERSGSNSGQG